MKKILLIILPLLLIVGCSEPVEDSTLINKDGLMYISDSDKPYTGEVFTNYSTGEKLYQGTYENGLLIQYSYLNKDGSVKEPINYEETLNERDGAYYTKDTNKPYSGPIFSLYSNGKKKVEGTSKDGIMDGLRTGWYSNGQKEYERTYKDGTLDGLWTKWYSNGQKKEEVTYKGVDDVGIITLNEWGGSQREGKWTTWYSNGQKEWERTYKDGIVNGLYTQWYLFGQKWYEGTSKDGKKDGLFTQWYSNGQKMWEETYKDGDLISEKKVWNEDGSVY